LQYCCLTSSKISIHSQYVYGFKSQEFALKKNTFILVALILTFPLAAAMGQDFKIESSGAASSGPLTVTGDLHVTGNLLLDGKMHPLTVTVYARYERSPVGEYTFMPAAGKIEDTASSINASHEWIVPVDGIYTLTNEVQTSDNETRAFAVIHWGEGTTKPIANDLTVGHGGWNSIALAVTTIRLLKGDKLKFHAGNNGSGGVQRVSIVRIGP